MTRTRGIIKEAYARFWNGLVNDVKFGIFDKYVIIDINVNDASKRTKSMAGVRQFSEEDVVTKALDVFWRLGFRETTMPSLAAATGVQRGSLYNAYGGKQTLFLLSFDRYADAFLNSARAALANPEPRAAITGFLASAIANMTSGTPARGCLTTRTVLEMEADDEIAAKVRRLLDDLKNLVRTALSTSAARKALVLKPDLAAELIVTFTRGLAVMERAYRDRSRLERTAAALVSLLFHG